MRDKYDFPSVFLSINPSSIFRGIQLDVDVVSPDGVSRGSAGAQHCERLN